MHTLTPRQIYKRKYWLDHKEQQREYRIAWRKKNKAKDDTINKKSRLKLLYNMTLEDYDNILKIQNNLCALCRKPLDLTINNPIDHDHKCCKSNKSCGKCVRGIIHDRCNKFIAYIECYPHLLTPALKYIKFEQVDKDC